MNQLDVISLQSAKDNLAVDYNDYDVRITNLIKAAVDWVETYTGWYLYQRDLIIYSTSYTTKISAYPVQIVEVKNKDGVIITVLTVYNTLYSTIYCPPQSSIKLTVGFAQADLSQIPGTLIEAANKLIVYLFENKDMYGTTLPTDIQLLLNQYRRSATIL